MYWLYYETLEFCAMIVQATECPDDSTCQWRGPFKTIKEARAYGKILIDQDIDGFKMMRDNILKGKVSRYEKEN